MTRIYVTAAAGALDSNTAPVGGGVAVIEALLPHLDAQFDLTCISPGARRTSAPGREILPVPSWADAGARALLDLDARAYARFALEWEAALAGYFDGIDPAGAVVIANDISEGPPFARLHARGFRQIALFHVVVADFVAQRHLRIPAPRAAALWRTAERLGLAALAPEMAGLVWRKEADAARLADACIVPSSALADALAACCPGTGVRNRTRVIPWGVIGEPDPARRSRRRRALDRHGIDPNRFLILALSRISPEKRLGLLIRALRRLERESPSTADQISLAIAGAPAYMGGARCLIGLQREAARLDRIPVHWTGYVSGGGKWDLLAAADLFASPSQYEAYGLAIAQALASGTPAVAAPHAGASAILAPELGWIAQPDRPRGDISPRAFAAAIRRAHAEHGSPDADRRRRAAAEWGARNRFDHAAREIACLVCQVAGR